MRVTIGEKILKEFQRSNKNLSVQNENQDEFNWYFKIITVNEQQLYKVNKPYIKHENGCYHFNVYILKEDTTWSKDSIITIENEMKDNSEDYWRDPEPIRPYSLQGLRIKLHQAYNITRNIYEAYYLISNEIYQTTVDLIRWFEEDKDGSEHEKIFSYNMMKFYQAYEVFKEDINNKNFIDNDLLSSPYTHSFTSQ